MNQISHEEVKIIKRYRNRKLYDTKQSCYVTLADIAKMVKKNENIKILNNKDNADITTTTLTQIIFETEKNIGQYPPVEALRAIIQYGTGNLSGFLAHLGVFDEKAMVTHRTSSTPKGELRTKSHLAQNQEKASSSKEAPLSTILPNANKTLAEEGTGKADSTTIKPLTPVL